MNLQSKYRLERDKIFTIENENYYFAYKFSDSKIEIHILEIYIKEEKRGNSKLYFDEILEFIKKIDGIKYIFGFIWPNVLGSERSICSMIKYGFKIHSVDSERIILMLGV